MKLGEVVQAPGHTECYQGMSRHSLNKKSSLGKKRRHIRSMVLSMPKIQDRYSNDRVERDYMYIQKKCHYVIPELGSEGEVE